jgi:hypothetical protein
MATPSSSSSTEASAVNPFGATVQEKLTSTNFLVWKAVVLPAVRHLDGSIKAPAEKISTKTKVDGKKVVTEVDNPAYAAWIEKYHQVLFYLLGTMSREVKFWCKSPIIKLHMQPRQRS